MPGEAAGCPHFVMVCTGINIVAVCCLGPWLRAGFLGLGSGCRQCHCRGSQDPQPAAVLSLGTQEDVGRGLVCPGGTRVQQPAVSHPPQCLPWSRWQLRPPQLVSPPASCLGVTGPWDGVSAAVEEEERQVRPLQGGGARWGAAGARWGAADGWGQGWGWGRRRRMEVRGAPGMSQGPQTQQGGRSLCIWGN